MSNTVILPKYLRIGDRVVMQMDQEARAWGRQGVPDGTLGTVIGFSRYKHYEPLFYKSPNRESGVYEGNGSAVVSWDTGTEDTPSCHDLWWTQEDAVALKVARGCDSAWNEAFDKLQYIEPLPDLPFFPLDVVREHNSGEEFRVRAIVYDYLGRVRYDGSPMPVYQLFYPKGGTTTLGLDDLDLVSRGNLWKWFNDKDSVSFDSLKEELEFHQGLGHLKQVPCLATGLFAWDDRGLLNDAIASGLVDTITYDGQFLPSLNHSKGYIRAYKIVDPDLSARSNEQLRLTRSIKRSKSCTP